MKFKARHEEIEEYHKLRLTLSYEQRLRLRAELGQPFLEKCGLAIEYVRSPATVLVVDPDGIESSEMNVWFALRLYRGLTGRDFIDVAREVLAQPG